MNTIKEILHKKREATEKHIKQLQQEGKQGIRYTAMILLWSTIAPGEMKWFSPFPLTRRNAKPQL